MELEWKEVDGFLRPVLTGDHAGQEVAWAPQPGSQDAFLQSPVFETLLEGPRGGGKTDALLMDYGQHVGQGFGRDWRGILFRQTYKQLQDVIGKSKQWFPRIWPQARYNESKAFWHWPDGEILYFSYFERLSDYWTYHGHSYPWIAWEELTTWADFNCYTRMMSCCRSTNPKIPRKYRSTTNPYGPGHNWVKARFQLPVLPGKIIGRLIREKDKPDRVAVHSELTENKVLLFADPDYVNRIREAARNRSEEKAWIEGSWDIVAGGMFDDIWEPRIHIVPDIPLDKIPDNWRVDRSYDHGQSKPFSVGWWAESNGEPIRHNGHLYGRVRGDLYRVAEWYGYSGTPNEGVRMLSSEIALGIREREKDWGIDRLVVPGPADSSIFDDHEPNKSVAGAMRAMGVRWIKSDKGPGSRKQGWERIREMLKGAKPGLEGVREKEGLFVCERCRQFIRTMPVLPRDDDDLDDVDTDAEDHVGDEVRYRTRVKRREALTGNYRG